MFTDSDVDVIYITTPHNTHIEFMKKAIRNGKHILVEKSITLNSHELNEVMEYPRAFEAAITYTESGEKEWVKEGDTQDALIYELLDMEKAINGDKKCMLLDYTKDVMDMMTEFRNSWNFKYPEEEL